MQGEGERGGRFTFEQRLYIGKLVSASIILSSVRGLDVGPLLWLFFCRSWKALTSLQLNLSQLGWVKTLILVDNGHWTCVFWEVDEHFRPTYGEWGYSDIMYIIIRSLRSDNICGLPTNCHENFNCFFLRRCSSLHFLCDEGLPSVLHPGIPSTLPLIIHCSHNV